MNLETKCHMFLEEPVKLSDNLTIWAKAHDAEGYTKKTLPVMYSIFHDKINADLRARLKHYGLLLESISVSKWKRIQSPIEPQILKIILDVNKFRQQAWDITKRSPSYWAVEYKAKKYRMILINFKRGSHNIKKPKKGTLALFFNMVQSLQPKWSLQNPFSRKFSVEFKTKIFKRDNYTCQYCNWQNGVTGREDRVLTLDHVVPVAFGGTAKEKNIITACLGCNVEKNDKILPFLMEKCLKDKHEGTENKGNIKTINK